MNERLELRYVPIDEVVLWEDNAKLHDMGGLTTSIKKYGFRDPSAFDSKLGALIEGNGRAEALSVLRNGGEPAPRGILTDEDGRWLMPVLFGIDSKSKALARQYAVDHNNLTMGGGDFTPFDVARMWDKDGYRKILSGFLDDGNAPVSLDLDDIALLLADKMDDDDTADGGAETDGADDIDGDGDEGGDVITIRFRNAIMRESIMSTIGGIIDRNPQWEAQIKGG